MLNPRVSCHIRSFIYYGTRIHAKSKRGIMPRCYSITMYARGRYLHGHLTSMQKHRRGITPRCSRITIYIKASIRCYGTLYFMQHPRVLCHFNIKHSWHLHPCKKQDKESRHEMTNLRHSFVLWHPISMQNARKGITPFSSRITIYTKRRYLKWHLASMQKA